MDGLRLLRSAAFGHNRYLHVARFPDNPVDKVSAQESVPVCILRTRHENLCDSMKTGEIDERVSDVCTLQNSRFDVEIAGEIDMAFYRFSFGRGQTVGLGFGVNIYRKAVGLEVVSHPSASPNEHGS